MIRLFFVQYLTGFLCHIGNIISELFFIHTAYLFALSLDVGLICLPWFLCHFGLWANLNYHSLFNVVGLDASLDVMLFFHLVESRLAKINHLPTNTISIDVNTLFYRLTSVFILATKNMIGNCVLFILNLRHWLWLHFFLYILWDNLHPSLLLYFLLRFDLVSFFIRRMMVLFIFLNH